MMKTWTNRIVASMLAAVFALGGCEKGGIASVERTPPSWPAVLAEAALGKREEYDGVVERPVVNVATATGLEHYERALSLVSGAADRDARPRYVLRTEKLKRYRNITRVPEVPVEGDPPPIPEDSGGWFSHRLISGPYTLALDAVEVDTETRKVAVYSVWATVPPYVLDGEVRRFDAMRPVLQYRVEGHWDGARWTAGVLESWEGGGSRVSRPGL